MSAPESSVPPLAVVLNPNAGGGLAMREWPRLEAELKRRGQPYELILEDSGEDALARIQALPPRIAVLAVGGDGTVGALLPALVSVPKRQGRPLAVVPLGTGNDFAGMLGLKTGQFAEALDRLTFQPRDVDALEVRILEGDGAGRTHVLLNGLGLGFDAAVTANMARAPKQFQGFARYAWSAVATVRELHLSEVQITLDGQPFYSGPSPIVAVMNGTRYGGGFLISPRSSPRDGLLDVVAGGPMNRFQLVKLMLRVLRGTHLDQPQVRTAQGHEVTVRWDTPTPLHLDGDLHGQVTAIRVRVLKGVVKLLNG
ncbi:diacylglycerol/lipid kinase family protein [Deinococcus marmoris]|uniref:Diacylglycerol kinase-related protein n=1 Tax=Deinococcus marmoris TaxID=249408 RepID=A0A1U7NYU5_9DEIO|nr:diacylglycerol kinase family protein [Deinococcus marmoris]OLV18080.1 Diacylglycerol kinase-related protein [Deinococcus marmoris]